MARAYSIIGSGYRYSGYVWTGDPSTSAFTCSGVVDYALGLPTNSNWPASLASKIKARGTWVSSVSDLKYGDIVCYVGHVGVYIGGGQVIDSCPNGGVQVRSIYWCGCTFLGGGAIV